METAGINPGRCRNGNHMLCRNGRAWLKFKGLKVETRYLETVERYRRQLLYLEFCKNDPIR